ncbi:ABC transporter substrate-binding protein [Mangrovicoccus sp. HB161399]|uniref:ABC transporter substrate-binding protein n=1 Tax=Mangrovicoccus sp. HB161399 TaxID=2720392 RepID=UPI001552628B|nr:ABC transporter substrate-binding protein [Mangrovicoccus sp. HB161399]
MAKTFLTATAALAALSSAATAQDLTEVSFGTNWVAQAEHGGFYQAVADGTYEACGLDVTIVPGGPQANNRALLMAGKIEFNMGGNMLLAYNAVKEGIPLVVVAASFQKEPQVLMTHPGKVSSFEGLKDLGTMIIGDNGFQSYYQWLIHDYGFSAEKRVPYTFNPARFIADEDSAQQGYITSEPYAVEKEGGFVPDIWLLADAGFSTYSTTIETMQATIDEHPEVVKCFVEGTAIGWANFLYGDNAAAVEAIKGDNPDMSDEQIAFSIEKLKEYGIVDSGDTLEMGIGAMTDERNQDFYQKMVASGVIEDGIDIASSYTTEFSNTGAALATVKELTGK